MKEMFEASVDGQPYDTERWGQYFRPAGVQAPAGEAAVAPVAKAASASVDDVPFDADEPVAAAAAPVVTENKTGQNAQDILAMIRSRQQK